VKVLKELLMDFTSLFVIILGVAIAEISIVTRNPMFSYVWCGVILPVSLLLTSAYLVKTGKIPRNRMKVWIVIVCGILLTSFSGILTFSSPNLGIILLLAGLFLTISPCLILRPKKWNIRERQKAS
jgi:membrane protein CcdC involved in cytochrome C biogenesis